MEGEHRPRLCLQVMPRSNRPGKCQRPVVTGDQQMLAVIDDVSRGGIGKRGGTPPQRGALFQKKDRET